MADQLDLQRIGPQHQAGSDSLLTGAAFFKMREMFFEDNIDDVKYCGHLYGLGTTFVNGNMTGVPDETITAASSVIINSSSSVTTSATPSTAPVATTTETAAANG